MTQEMTRTPWYPGSVKPARVGWFEREWWPGQRDLDYWDGQEWRWAPNRLARANQTLPWRGLTAPAKQIAKLEAKTFTEPKP